MYFSILQAELMNIQQVISWYNPTCVPEDPCQPPFHKQFYLVIYKSTGCALHLPVLQLLA